MMSQFPCLNLTRCTLFMQICSRFIYLASICTFSDRVCNFSSNIVLYRDIDSIIESIDTSLDGQISYMELENGLRIARCVSSCLLLQQSLKGL